MADSVPFVVVIFDARGWSCSVVVEAVVDCGWSEKVSNMIEIGTVVSVICKQVNAECCGMVNFAKKSMFIVELKVCS